MLRSTLATLRRLGLDYSCYRIYSVSLADLECVPVPLPAGCQVVELARADLERSPFGEVRECRDYHGPDAVLYGVCRADGAVVCAQCVWYGDRYRDHQFWPIENNAAASMHLVCAPSERGKGYATWLKRETARRLRQRGFARLYSRIWWTHSASIRVSEKAGWEHVATVFDLKMRGRAKPIRVVRHQHRLPGFTNTYASPH